MAASSTKVLCHMYIIDVSVGCYGDKEQFLWSSSGVMNPNRSSVHRGGQSPAADDLLDDWLFLSTESAGPQGPVVSRDEPDDQEAEDRGQLKSKLISAWNSVKYGLFLM